MANSSADRHLEDLQEIRSLMERSSRFISLSGLSGICAGTFALAGAFITWQYVHHDYAGFIWNIVDQVPALWFLAAVACGVLLMSVVTGIFFTTRNAKRKGQKIWDASSRNLLINLAIPLIAGGLFCLVLLYHAPALMAPATLVFYGLALINASKYTLSDIRYLGFCEIITGLLASVSPGYGLLFWAFGFGVLHIIYGAMMYFKYER
ncbi:MAG: hypothetical protein K1X61_15465 [Chitinophagales bacterium]|nr:hypothetical protein [Chitinophagales bacterium]